MRRNVARSTDLIDTKPYPVELEGNRILLIRTGKSLFAVEDSCPHQSGTLRSCVAVGEQMSCQLHGVTIHLRSGEIVRDAGFRQLLPVATFQCGEQDGVVWIDL